jgi:hypothetical protein
MHITVLYGKLLENGHLEHPDRNVNPLKRSGHCEVPLATTFKTLQYCSQNVCMSFAKFAQ